MSNYKLRDSNSLDTRQPHELRGEQPAREADDGWYQLPDENGNFDFYTDSGKRVGRATSMEFLQRIVTDHARAALVPGLVDTLSELTDLMEDVISGAYEPDSFTTQPARIALAAARKAGVE